MPKPKKSKLILFRVADQYLAVPLDMTEGVAMLPTDIVPVPGLKSRVALGLGYIQGKIMMVLDIAPLFNAARLKGAHECLLLHLGTTYVAIKITRFERLEEFNRIVVPQSSRKGIIADKVSVGKTPYSVLDCAQLIESSVCS